MPFQAMLAPRGWRRVRDAVPLSLLLRGLCRCRDLSGLDRLLAAGRRLDTTIKLSLLLPLGVLPVLSLAQPRSQLGLGTVDRFAQ